MLKELPFTCNLDEGVRENNGLGGGGAPVQATGSHMKSAHPGPCTALAKWVPMMQNNQRWLAAKRDGACTVAAPAEWCIRKHVHVDNSGLMVAGA